MKSFFIRIKILLRVDKRSDFIFELNRYHNTNKEISICIKSLYEQHCLLFAILTTVFEMFYKRLSGAKWHSTITKPSQVIRLISVPL